MANVTAELAIPVGDVIIPAGRRKPTDEQIQARARSMNEIGLLQPILLNDENRLIAGGTRLAAAKSLGWKTIPYRTLHFDDLHARLAEIDENIERSNLTALEEGQALKERKEIYLTLHPETKKGSAGGAASGRARGGDDRTTDKMSVVLTSTPAMSYVDDTAQKTGKTARTIYRDVAVAESLTPSTQTQIAGTPVADSKSQLKQLADLPANQQEKVAGLIGAGKAKTVNAAKKLAGIADEPKSGKSRGGGKAAEPEAVEISEADKAKFHLAAWVTTLDAMLSKSPTIDEYRAQWPSQYGDEALDGIRQARKALAKWKREIK